MTLNFNFFFARFTHFIFLFLQKDFTTDFYFRQVWTDSRLAFTETDRIRELSVGAEVADKIWVSSFFISFSIVVEISILILVLTFVLTPSF